MVAGSKKILIVEDEIKIVESIQLAFEREQNLKGTHVMTGAEALAQVAQTHFDLLILDVGLPDQSGFDLCKSIRKKSDVPIFFLTARHEEIDRIVGLEVGADDYLVKPFSPRELVARVKALFRRLDVHTQSEKTPVPLGFEIDNFKKRICFVGKALDLSATEFEILKSLVTRPEQVFSREQLLEKISNEPSMSLERSVDTHIKNIRAKLEALQTGAGLLIETRRGMGYALKGR